MAVASERQSPERPRSSEELRAYARDRLIESRLTPNAISMTGLALNVVAAVLVTQDLYLLAGTAFVVGSVMDTLDGRYSRMSGKGSPFGAFLDSTLDRVAEGVVLAAIAAEFAKDGNAVAVAATVAAVLLGQLVSYTRARAEALQVECKVGLASRPVRVVIMSIGLLLGGGLGGRFDAPLLEISVYVVAVLSLITVGQRVAHVRRTMREWSGPPPVDPES